MHGQWQKCYGSTFMRMSSFSFTDTPRLIFPLTLEDPVTAWGGEGEQERIIQGLEVVMETLEESEMFSVPVDIEEEVLYCSVVPFPTDLSTILERLKNGFYRLAK